jgi:hypothetical protein
MDPRSDYLDTIMSAHSPRSRSIVVGSRRFRSVVAIDHLPSSRVTERAAPLMRLEGPDIALSGRQILLKALL